MSEGEFFQIWQPLVSHLLILTGYVEPDIFPAIAKIIRETVCHTLRSFGQQVEYDIGPSMHDVPGFSSPLVCLRQKEVRGHTDTYQFAGLDFVVAMAVLLQGIVEIVGAIDVGPGLPSLLIKGIHIAVGTAGTDADAAMPGIPDIMHTSYLCLKDCSYSLSGMSSSRSARVILAKSSSMWDLTIDSRFPNTR